MIIAEDITSRFLNVISLFNGHIPIVAIQVKAFKIENHISLLFTKVLSEIQFGTLEDDTRAPETNRAYWDDRAKPETVRIADTLLEYISKFAPGFQLKYNKIYIGLFQDNKAQNFVQFKPQKVNMRLELGCEIPDEFRAELENEGLNVGDFTPHWRVTPIYLSKEDITSKREVIIKAMKYAYDHYYS